jgi:ABC-type Fe3+ transport system permease subunit
MTAKTWREIRWPRPTGGPPGAIATGLLAFPLLLPALYGLGSTAWTLLQARVPAASASLWPDARVQGLLAQGLALSLLAALLATVLGALCALALLLPRGRRWRLALGAGLAASFCFGSVVHLLGWRALFPGVAGGVQGWALAVLVLGLRYAPLAAALLAGAMVTLERAELETALATGGARAVSIVASSRLLRLAGMAVAAVAALVFCESEVPALAGVPVYAEEFLAQVALEPAAPVAAALGWPLMAMALACAALLSRLPRLRATACAAPSRGWVGQWAHPPALLAAFAPALALAIAWLPLALLAWGAAQASGNWPAHASAALLASLRVAVLSALLALAWAWALARLAACAGGATLPALNALLWLMMLWPSALTGIALAGWNAPESLDGEPRLVLAHALRILPFATWVLLAFEALLPRAPAEQLRVLGARGWPALQHVHLPAALPGLLAAFALGAGLSLAELTATVLTVPPGLETVILRLYNLLHYGDQRGVMLLALLQGLTVALAFAALLLLRLPRGHRDAGT